jgi:hypothetical protein
MLSVLDAAAEEEGMCRAEVMRQVFDVYAASRNGEFTCPGCASELQLPVGRRYTSG